jgi:hypothetical protein
LRVALAIQELLHMWMVRFAIETGCKGANRIKICALFSIMYITVLGMGMECLDYIRQTTNEWRVLTSLEA